MTESHTLTILAAGFGTRLGELGRALPKGLLKIGDETIVSKLMRQLSVSADNTVIVSNSRFLSQYQIIGCATVDNGVSSADDARGAVADAQLAFRSLNAKTCNLVSASDNVFSSDAEISCFCSASKTAISSGVADVCIATQTVDRSDASRFGIMTLDDRNFVTSFAEKPVSPESDIAALALYAMSSKAVKFLTTVQTSPSDNMGSMIEHLIKSHKCLAIKIASKWFDVGTQQSLHDARSYFERDMKHG